MKNNWSPQAFVRWITFALVVVIPLGTKKFLFPFPLPFTNVYVNEYSAAFLFGSDLLLLGLLGAVLVWLRPAFIALLKRYWLLIALLCIGLLTLLEATNPGLGFYVWIRLALVVLGALAIASAVKEEWVNPRILFVGLALSAILEALIGIRQFLVNGSAGLTILGEPVITSLTKGVGRVVVAGGALLRAQGTMPHANILAGFLLMGLGAFYYLFLTTPEDARRIHLAAIILGILTLSVGLAVTFSRSGWITTLVLTTGVLLWGWLRKGRRRRTLELLAVLAGTSLFLFVVLGWAIGARASLSPTEGPVADRVAYDHIGLEMIGAHPLGVGIGNQLLAGVHEGFYQRHNIPEWWRWQPIHNIYLLIGVEVGLPGLVAFLWFLMLVMRSALPHLRRGDPDAWFLLLILVALLGFALVDHFLWDLENGRLMLWVILGILMGASGRPHRSMDRTLASEAGN